MHYAASATDARRETERHTERQQGSRYEPATDKPRPTRRQTTSEKQTRKISGEFLLIITKMKKKTELCTGDMIVVVSQRRDEVFQNCYCK